MFNSFYDGLKCCFTIQSFLACCRAVDVDFVQPPASPFRFMVTKVNPRPVLSGGIQRLQSVVEPISDEG